jgi:type II secretory pathway component GspD/PulD (secretin)
MAEQRIASPVRLFAAWLASVWLVCAAPAHAAESAAAGVHASGANPQSISLDADNTSAEAVLELIAGRYGLNLVTSPETREVRVTVHVSGVSVDDAVALVVKAAGLTYQRIGKSIVVGPSSKLEDKAATSTSVLPLRHADPERVRTMLEGLGAVVRVDAASSQIIVNAPVGLRTQLTEIVESLDVPARQVELRARLVEVSTQGLQSLGIDWAKLTSFTTILTEGIPGGSSGTGSPTDQLPPSLGYRDLSSFGRIARQSEAFKVTLDLLIQEGHGKVLSDVKLATMSDAPATIHIGDVIPYLVTGPPSVGGIVTYTVEREETGVSLKIVPRVLESGEILTAIEPSVSSIVAFRGPDASLPQTKERTATTSVRVHDGETIVIAGLQSEEEQVTVDKVPLLGDIPLLGRLFQHYKKNKQKTDLVIEITPRLL